MRKSILLVALVAAAAPMAPAVAHPEHEEMRPPPSPTQEARSTVFRMISQSRLSASWAQATVVGTTARVRDGVNQTVVTFRNDAEQNRSRRMLYVVVANGSVVSTGHQLN